MVASADVSEITSSRPRSPCRRLAVHRARSPGATSSGSPMSSPAPPPDPAASAAPGGRWWWLALLGIWLAATAADRLWLGLDQRLPAWDQADYLNSAIDHGRALGLLPGGGWPGWAGLLDLSPKIPPLASLVNGTVMAISGDGPAEAAWALAVWHGLLLLAVAAWGRELVGPGFALLAAALTALAPALAELRVDYTLDLALAACTTLALWLLGRWQAPGGGRWGQAILAALAVAAAVLVKQSALLMLVPPCLWAAGRGLGQRGRRLQVLAALAIVLGSCAPWLRHNWITTIGGTNRAVLESAAAEGDPPVLSLASLLWYPRLWPAQLGGVSLVIGLAGWALMAVRRLRARLPLLNLPPGWGWLVGCCLSGWLCTTLSPNKGDRYIASVLPLLILLLARGWWELGLELERQRERRGRPGRRAGALALALGLAGLAGGSLQSRAAALQTSRRSPLPELMAELQRRVGPQPTTVLLLPGAADLNDHTATFYGRQGQGQILVRSLGKNRAEHPLVLERAEWVVLASGDQGHRRPAIQDLSRRLRRDGRFALVSQWPWSQGRQVELWRRRPGLEPPPFDASFIAMASQLAEGPGGLARVLEAIGPHHQLDAHFLYQRRVEAWARRRLRTQPDDAEALWSMALLRVLQQRPAEAATWFGRLEAVLPANPWPSAYRSLLLLADWQPWPARQVAEQALGRPGQAEQPVLRALADLSAASGGDPRGWPALRRSLPPAIGAINTAIASGSQGDSESGSESGSGSAAQGKAATATATPAAATRPAGADDEPR